MLPFDDSRRLTGGNLHFAGCGAVLEAQVPLDDAAIAAWRARIADALAALGWPHGAVVARRHATGTELAFEAPVDQLFTATEVNEWALCATLAASGRATAAELDAALAHAAEVNPLPEARAVGLPPVVAQPAAFVRFGALAQKERNPQLTALLAAARDHHLPWLLDDEALTLGHGAGGRTHSLDSLPKPERVRWDALHAIPLAVVTGSNGKTTTVRLIAAALGAMGWVPGYSCTDGVYVAGHALGSGDYSGPQGARRVLREARTEAAVLEAARGGILRRGLAIARADAVVVTNVTEDHFGEYGVHDLDDLADAKLAVARLVGPHGLLVLNADDPVLRARGIALHRAGTPVGWFALELDDARDAAIAGTTGSRPSSICGVREGHLVLEWRGLPHDLGNVIELPLTADGTARYNIANLAAAALAAAAAGVTPELINKVFARFGADPGDNAGRLMRYAIGGVSLLIDYAHNAEGLEGLLAVALPLIEPQRGGGRRGRLGLLLGHAGNRLLSDFDRLAAVAVAAKPDLIVIKEIGGMERGRAPGEVPRLIHEALLEHGASDETLTMEGSELAAVRRVLEWAHDGDVLVLPVHALAARAATLSLIDQLEADGWRAGQPLP